MKRIVILGAGTGGTIMANRLSSLYRSELRNGGLSITIVDHDQKHVYQPGLLFIPFGIYGREDVLRPRQKYLPDGVEYRPIEVDRVVADQDEVHLADGSVLNYDLLIIATGTRLALDETEGLTGPGWREKVFDFYTLDGAMALRDALNKWQGGRLAVNIVDLPIKCPVAPLEFAFLADWYFTDKGIRDRVDITYVTPLDGAFTKPIASRAFGDMLAQKGVELVTEFNTGEVDGANGRLVSWDERTVDFDLLVSIPLHSGAEFVGRSPGLGDDTDFVLTDPNTLQAKVKPNIFTIGDATNVPTSKAGSVVHFQTEVLTENIKLFLDGKAPKADFDGHANCFIETGFNKAMLIDFNYDVEPLPGKFPFPGIGPMVLLKENRMNHWGKMLFRWVYWNVLLPGRDMPGVGAQMSMRGKRRPQTETVSTRKAA